MKSVTVKLYSDLFCVSTDTLSHIPSERDNHQDRQIRRVPVLMTWAPVWVLFVSVGPSDYLEPCRHLYEPVQQGRNTSIPFQLMEPGWI